LSESRQSDSSDGISSSETGSGSTRAQDVGRADGGKWQPPGAGSGRPDATNGSTKSGSDFDDLDDDSAPRLRRKSPPPDISSSQSRDGFEETFGDKSRASKSGSKGSTQHHWGAPGGRGTLGLEKHVNVEVCADEVVIGNDVIVPVGQGESRKELTDLLLAGLHGHIQTWGAPPPDFYWVPTVRFIVKAGGSAHCARLEGILKEAGIRSVFEQPAPRRSAPARTQ
jgi:hypothetical protein